jgi:hypothetical protein
MLCLFQSKMISVVKYFQESHFLEKYFPVFGTYGKLQMFFIFIFLNIFLFNHAIYRK